MHIGAWLHVLVASSSFTSSPLLLSRRQLHSLLGLPDNRPAVRASNALDYSPTAAAAGGALAAGGQHSSQARLKDVHQGLGLPGEYRSASSQQGIIIACITHVCNSGCL